ncbi:MAG TPA: BREX system ATP-binding domain-containing protein [Dehalococcoidia bacterium]|nr:BREX system ATP-binding domain-containing protein [Dehalococcoidia bacterium]
MMNTTPAGWLEVIEREYLKDFIREGGAAVKFLIPQSEQSRVGLRDGLEAAAGRNQFQFAFVDAAETRIHLIDRLFYEVARQIDWDSLAQSYLRRLLADSGLRLPSTSYDFTLRSLSASNGLPEPLFRTQVHGLIINSLYRDYAMSQEFRFAMIFLCQAQLDADENPGLSSAIKEWLRGELRLVSAVRRALIFQKIARHNARHLLFSLAHWLKVAGMSGMVLAIDISRYTDARRPSDREGGLYYTAAATLDAYEVLRQLIDGTDELEYGFVCVIADALFLADDRRGLRAYQALYMRIADEVRDRYRQNPLAALTRLDEAS